MMSAFIQGGCQIADRKDVRSQTGRMSGFRQGGCQSLDREDVRQGYQIGRMSGLRQCDVRTQIGRIGSDMQDVRIYIGMVSGFS